MKTRAFEPRDRRFKLLYDKQACDYDSDRFGSTKGGAAKRIKNDLVIQILGRHGMLHSKARILDVPSGTGRVAHALLETQVGHICAVDISPKMLARNAEGVSAQQLPRLAFVEANMKELPAPDESYDAAVVASFFYLIPSTQYPAYVADVWRVLRPGGLLIAEVSNALAACNPRTFVAIAIHKHVRRKETKSYVYPWQIGSCFAPFVMLEYWGAEFPLFVTPGPRYQSIAGLMSGRRPWKWCGGKFTVVLQKRCS